MLSLQQSPQTQKEQFIEEWDQLDKGSKFWKKQSEELLPELEQDLDDIEKMIESNQQTKQRRI